MMEDRVTPEYLKMSTAAALTLGFKQGRFYRNARLGCINLLQTYAGGCQASCAYCGLSGKRSEEFKEGSFIRVDWPSYTLEQIIEKMDLHRDRFTRICISMVTRKRASRDVVHTIETIRRALDTPISVLICPTVTGEADLVKFRECGADKIGVSIDAATPELFDKYRGKGVKGPHRWEKYWDTYRQVVEIYGRGNTNVHFIVGLGETEKEMTEAMQRVADMGGETHLFSFYPEQGSPVEEQSPPAIGHYRRIQMARYLIDEKIAQAENFTFDSSGRLADFGIPTQELEKIIDSGQPFMTSGCKGRDGKVACNRPFANYPPPEIRNYPFLLEPDDIELARNQIRQGFSCLPGENCNNDVK